MKSGKQFNDSKSIIRTEQITTQFPGVSSYTFNRNNSWEDETASSQSSFYLEEEDEELPPVSKLKDGLYIGAFEGSSNQDVCLLLHLNT